MDLKDKYPFRQIDYHKELGVDEHIPLGNMSFCRLDDGANLVAVRQFNYKIRLGNDAGGWFGGFLDYRAYFFAITDKDFNFINRVECDIPGLDMYEDLRLVRYGNIIQASGTDASQGQDRYVPVSLSLMMSEGKLSLLDKTVFPFVREKNYMPLDDVKGLFVSDMAYGTMKTITTAEPSCKKGHRCIGSVPYRGSTQLLRWRDGYVCMVHGKKRNLYTDALVFFDEALDKCVVTQPFTVFRNISSINFCCGMSIEGDKAQALICLHDRYSYLFTLPLDDIYSTATITPSSSAGPKYNPLVTSGTSGTTIHLRNRPLVSRNATATDVARMDLRDKALEVLRRRAK